MEELAGGERLRKLKMALVDLLTMWIEGLEREARAAELEFRANRELASKVASIRSRIRSL